MRNNILLTFSDHNNSSNLGIYKQKKTRELININEINLISNQMKQTATKIHQILKDSNLDNIYNHEKDHGLLNHVCIRENEYNEYMLEFYIQYDDTNFLNGLKNIKWHKLSVVSVNYQITKNKDFRKPFLNIFGNYLTYKINNSTFSISAGCFFQTNNKILSTMYNDIINFTKKKNYENTLLDLYCGVGVISILLSSYFNKIIGIEVNQNSIDMATYNSYQNKCENINFICSPVEDALDKISYENAVIFINPPRRGIYNSVIDKINNLKNVKQILYLSCCKKTLERDLQHFGSKYEILKEYDMFPGTNHKEYLVNIIKN